MLGSYVALYVLKLDLCVHTKRVAVASLDFHVSPPLIPGGQGQARGVKLLLPNCPRQLILCDQNAVEQY